VVQTEKKFKNYCAVPAKLTHIQIKQQI